MEKWSEKMTKTREEMIALGLPDGREGGGAKVIQDTITEQGRWTTLHDLIFRLPDMPEDLAYRTYYRRGSPEMHDEEPWEYEPAECVLVRRVPKVVDDWTDGPVKPIQPRIHVADLDPDDLIGIAPCDDGSEGWVVMQQVGLSNPEPVGDEHGQIVYFNIMDAAEVLKTGKVWKHDMGEDAPEE